MQRIGQTYTTHHPNVGTHLALERAIIMEAPYVQDVPPIPGLFQYEDPAGPVAFCHRLSPTPTKFLCQPFSVHKSPKQFQTWRNLMSWRKIICADLIFMVCKTFFLKPLYKCKITHYLMEQETYQL